MHWPLQGQLFTDSSSQDAFSFQFMNMLLKPTGGFICGGHESAWENFYSGYDWQVLEHMQLAAYGAVLL